MKTIKIIIALFLITIFHYSCNNRNDKFKNDIAISSKITDYNNSNIIISKSLLKALDDLLIISDTNNAETNIIYLIFKKEKNECYLSIFKTYAYMSYYLKGYINYKNNIIVLYNSDYKIGSDYFIYDYDCCTGLIDTTKLIRDIPPKDYQNENSEKGQILHDPIGRKYKIQSKDSLELVYEGYL